MGLSKDSEREFARMLYVNDRITFKEIALRVKVSEKTISKWADLDGWDKLRKSLLTTRQNQLVHFYNQLEAMNDMIALRTPPVPLSKEADTMSKITSNIQKLETEVGLGEYVEVGKKILTFIQNVNLNDAINFKNYIDEFINDRMKNG